jgi:hypothetical protein
MRRLLLLLRIIREDLATGESEFVPNVKVDPRDVGNSRNASG